MEDFVTLTNKEYYEMKEDVKFLECLVAQGVGDWEGYEYAVDMWMKTIED